MTKSVEDNKLAELEEPAASVVSAETASASQADKNTTASDSDKSVDRPREYGGQAGLEPTRYGDWEKKGRCTDF